MSDNRITDLWISIIDELNTIEESGWYMYAVACYNFIPAEAIEYIFNTKEIDKDLGIILAKNPNTPKHILDKLVELGFNASDGKKIAIKSSPKDSHDVMEKDFDDSVDTIDEKILQLFEPNRIALAVRPYDSYFEDFEKINYWDDGAYRTNNYRENGLLDDLYYGESEEIDYIVKAKIFSLANRYA